MILSRCYYKSSKRLLIYITYESGTYLLLFKLKIRLNKPFQLTKNILWVGGVKNGHPLSNGAELKIKNFPPLTKKGHLESPILPWVVQPPSICKCVFKGLAILRSKKGQVYLLNYFTCCENTFH